MEEMSEPEAERDPLLKAILDLLLSAGYFRARESSVSAFDKVSGGLAWCIAAANSSVTDLDDVICSDQTKLGEVIEDALKSIKCPYPIQAHQVQLLDYEAVYPVVQWLVCHVSTIQASIGNEAAFLAHEIEEEESNIQKLKNLLIDEEISVKLLHEKLEKQELGVILRANLLLKRRCDDVPSQTELIQYEHRFSELYVQIQEKLRQTRKYYATYNALLEIKELMLKEISLLDSISSQFKDAMTSTSGRVRLIDSMERIVGGTKQKLEKVHLGLQSEKKKYDTLKETYAAKIAEQRRRSSLLKAFQEECARSEKLQSLITM
ncbi:hypothetical protein MRB53_006422 [Persea americana]|uniref:Uncharacterized protein n=1 Tax=Persea americana TaxID=3435 RepID=A0ACC2MGB9_PERAE|nr:hypothetical protein MRB53_006422 [Persea americana]|eukprot:TRINITY_DN197_c0_g1_i2.p1 TRINITY_DN197_c0_g1~~TRINITY_DN197_c0_g1_i2.p1  ORF type:complete len:320 (+),score=50.76 TRINITY_DN197_c0_g1_i2:106-1065(+)